MCHTLDKTQAQVLPLPLTNYVPVSKSQPFRTRGLITSVLAAPQCCSERQGNHRSEPTWDSALNINVYSY